MEFINSDEVIIQANHKIAVSQLNNYKIHSPQKRNTHTQNVCPIGQLLHWIELSENRYIILFFVLRKIDIYYFFDTDLSIFCEIDLAIYLLAYFHNGARTEKRVKIDSQPMGCGHAPKEWKPFFAPNQHLPIKYVWKSTYIERISIKIALKGNLNLIYIRHFDEFFCCLFVCSHVRTCSGLLCITIQWPEFNWFSTSEQWMYRNECY